MPESQAGPLLQGVHGFICNSCSTRASELFQMLNQKDGKPAQNLDNLEIKTPQEIKAYLDDYVIGQDA
ncbi:MAG: ATP-dependent Clp protease ATP-binding subunit ClpX, partial [Bacteroidales bacterium]|nr:ATP-dependent Clp protease ATP-binding subunit ClpX [Bacteroidales bacterium]